MIKKIVKGMLAVVLLCSCGHILRKYMKSIIESLNYDCKVYKINYFILREWVDAKKKGKKITEYLSKKNMKKIAIYGAGTFADMLLDEIGQTEPEIEVKYIVDAYASSGQYFKEIKVVCPKDINTCPEVDAIIITPMFDFIKIARDLQKQNQDLNIISLENLIL